MFPPMHQLVRLGHALAEWPVSSQQQARRNAMIALNACAKRRAEREDVDAYLAGRAARRQGTPTEVAPDAGVSAHG